VRAGEIFFSGIDAGFFHGKKISGGSSALKKFRENRLGKIREKFPVPGLEKLPFRSSTGTGNQENVPKIEYFSKKRD